MTRRTFLKAHATAAALATAAPTFTTHSAEKSELYRIKQGRIQQSVIPWCFKPMTTKELIDASVKIGLKSIELIGAEHWPALKENGLTCAIAGSHGFSRGFAHKEEHAQCLDILRKNIDLASKAGVPSIITFSGFRRAISDEEGTRNMVNGLKQIASFAEEKRVTVCLEMLNSRVNVEMKGHPDYFCDDIDKSVEICKRVSSERVKVLFDIYHVQIMQGDVIRRLKQHKDWIGHYHTAGVPGRNEIDDTQEIQYAPIMRAILETGYKGYVGQEFIPLRDKVQSLAEAAQICDV
ncbi:MAG TPA: TIM barrel protein [Candidatus Acidoferrum sp.]|nr:TIM barrel protein [Candidatus Acidoferrum sp.]